MIDKATAERIKETADIVDVVGDYVHLIRSGANFKGLCPFHNERTPSFSVNRSRNFCYCFSCHKGGSPVNFIMEMEGISYHDALMQLAKRYGIKVEERELTDEERARQTKREGLFVANEWAMQEMQRNLTQTAEGRDVGLEYLYSRGVTSEAIKAFRLGYALDSYTALTDAARRKGFDISQLVELGLVGLSSKGTHYDRFKGRVIFPILNISGKAIAFGGRDLKGGPAKYINSPESELYHKSNELYGIHQARQAISREDRCFLVEGYLDVIGMWQSGIQNVVASSGTALTDGQIAMIRRYTNNVTLIYDGDAAGIKASLRGIDMLLAAGMNVKVLLLPDGDDPDSFARKHTPEDFKAFIEKHQTDIIRFKVQVLLKEAGDDPQRRMAVINSVVESIAHIPDSVGRDIYARECSSMLRVGLESITDAVARRYKAIASGQRKMYSGNHPSPENPEPTEGAAVTPKPETSRISVETYPLLPLERKLIEFCVRYAFLYFCDGRDDDNPPVALTVIEFIRDELQLDNISFSVPPYSEVFSILLDMLPEYRRKADAKREEIERMAQTKRKEGIEEIASLDLSLREIENKERELETRISAWREQEFEEFSKSFSSIILTSHEDEIVRKISLRAVRERHQLSHIYSRQQPADREEDKLIDYIPRAITELKNGILDLQIKDLMAKLRETSGKNDYETERELQLKLTSIMRWRAQIAKDIGERIICPPSK